MLVHLLRELPGELDRLHVRPEGTPEDPLEEALDLALDCAKDAHETGRLPRSSLAGALTCEPPRRRAARRAGRRGARCRERSRGQGIEGAHAKTSASCRAPRPAMPQYPRAVARGNSGGDDRQRERRGRELPVASRAPFRAAWSTSVGRSLCAIPRSPTASPAEWQRAPRQAGDRSGGEDPDAGMERAPPRAARRLHGERQEREQAERREQRPGAEEKAGSRVAPGDARARRAPGLRRRRPPPGRRSRAGTPALRASARARASAHGASSSPAATASTASTERGPEREKGAADQRRDRREPGRRETPLERDGAALPLARATSRWASATADGGTSDADGAPRRRPRGAPRRGVRRSGAWPDRPRGRCRPRREGAVGGRRGAPTAAALPRRSCSRPPAAGRPRTDGCPRGPPRGSRRPPRRRCAPRPPRRRSRSGEMYASVPGTSPTAVSVSASSNCASPKSSTRTEISLLVLDEDVRGLDVAMDDPVAMRVRQAVEHLGGDLDRLGVVELLRRGAPRAACGPARTRTRCRRGRRRRRSRRPARSARGAGGRRPPSRARRAPRAFPRAGRSSARPRGRCCSSRASQTDPEPPRPSGLQRAIAIEDERSVGKCEGSGRHRFPSFAAPGERPSPPNLPYTRPRQVVRRDTPRRASPGPAGTNVTVHDDDILDFDFVDDETREIAPPPRTGTRPPGGDGPRGGGPRQPRFRAPHGITPLLRLAGLVALAILVVVLLAVWVQGCAGEDDQTTYGNYLADIGEVGNDSAKIGADLATLLTTPGLAQAELETKLGGLRAAAAARRRARTRPRPARPADPGERARGRGARAPGRRAPGPARHVPGDEGHRRPDGGRRAARRVGRAPRGERRRLEGPLPGSREVDDGDRGRRGADRAARRCSSRTPTSTRHAR